MDRRRRLVVAAIVACVLGVVPACSSSDDASDGTSYSTTAAASAELLDRSARAMAEVDHVAFSLERTGAEVAIDPTVQLTFDAAEGRYAAPASAEAVVEVTVLGRQTRIGVVAIDGEVWITNPLTGRWEAAPDGLGFDPAVLFDDERGLPALLRDGLQDPTLVDDGPDDQGRRHLRATIDGQRVATLTGGLVDQATEVELWIDADTGHLSECRLDVEVPDGTSEWVLTLSEYGEAVTIERPEPGSTG